MSVRVLMFLACTFVSFLTFGDSVSAQTDEGVNIETVRCIRDRLPVSIQDCREGDRIVFDVTVASHSPQVLVFLTGYHNGSGVACRPNWPKRVEATPDGRRARITTTCVQESFPGGLFGRRKSFCVWTRMVDAVNGETVFEKQMLLSP